LVDPVPVASAVPDMEAVQIHTRWIGPGPKPNEGRGVPFIEHVCMDGHFTSRRSA
jgi:hypothetical protein